MREMSCRGTTPTAELGRDANVSNIQLFVKLNGSGMKAECRDEEGGKRSGAAYCSKFTAHSVGSAGGVFLQATWAQVQPVAMVKYLKQS